MGNKQTVHTGSNPDSLPENLNLIIVRIKYRVLALNVRVTKVLKISIVFKKDISLFSTIYCTLCKSSSLCILGMFRKSQS